MAQGRGAPLCNCCIPLDFAISIKRGHIWRGRERERGGGGNRNIGGRGGRQTGKVGEPMHGQPVRIHKFRNFEKANTRDGLPALPCPPGSAQLAIVLYYVASCSFLSLHFGSRCPYTKDGLEFAVYVCFTGPGPRIRSRSQLRTSFSFIFFSLLE